MFRAFLNMDLKIVCFTWLTVFQKSDAKILITINYGVSHQNLNILLAALIIIFPM